MPFNDLDVFLRAAQALLQGSDPYAVSGVYYPLPFFFIFVPLAMLPLPLAYGIWTLVEGMIFVAILRQRALSVVLFMPVILTFLMGQIVMPMLGLFALLRSGILGGFALAWLLLKPQLVLLLAPWMFWQWWKNDRRQIVFFAVTISVLAIMAFVIQPDWLARWMAVSGERNRAARAPSLWGLLSFLPVPLWIASVSVLALVLVIWAWRQNDLDILMLVGFLINPLIISYDLTLLTVMIKNMRFWLALTLLSWFTFAISAWQLNERAVVVITLAILAVLLWDKRRKATI